MENHPLGCQTEDVSASVFKSNAPGEQVELAPRVLIVEDEMFVGLQYEDALTEAGINVVEIASTAEEAVLAAQDLQPNLVIMDIRLAGTRDGVDAAVEIFNRFGIRSIFASAFADVNTRERAEPAQPLAWLAKPVGYQKLVMAVQAALGDLDGGRGGGSQPMS